MTRACTRGCEIASNASWRLYYDGDCGLCNTFVGWLARLDFSHLITWTPYQSLKRPPGGLTWTDLERSAYLETGNGRLYEGFYAFRMITLKIWPLLPLAPIIWMPGMNLLGVSMYRWVARNRCRLSKCGISPVIKSS